MNVSFSKPPECIFRENLPGEEHVSRPGGQWLPGAYVNPAKNCLNVNSKRSLDDTMIVWRDEGKDDLPVNKMTLEELRSEVWLVARALKDLGLERGSAIAIDMPMNVHSVVIYLAIILAGYVVVSIADSFAAREISTRIKISKAKAIFTQDLIIRGERTIPLYRNCEFTAVEQPVDAFTNILFSSGTTGEPKAIPWTHATPFKAAADAWCHTDIQKGDVVAWPTNLGWMMGPWLVYASLLNGASIALYNGSPLGSSFAKFVQCRGSGFGHRDAEWRSSSLRKISPWLDCTRPRLSSVGFLYCN
ncbi:putative acyl-activating enzyme 17 [Morus notabilis]|uniref:Putative acyl-activating enzyme 17 n=1 Tax=Morus notabilis TaxID=981085 RepID=W9SUN8_9ROSA|nr:putative acyl-activating enzyme 17 [Morus notabilis]